MVARSTTVCSESGACRLRGEVTCSPRPCRLGLVRRYRIEPPQPMYHSSPGGRDDRVEPTCRRWERTIRHGLIVHRPLARVGDVDPAPQDVRSIPTRLRRADGVGPVARRERHRTSERELGARLPDRPDVLPVRQGDPRPRRGLLDVRAAAAAERPVRPRSGRGRPRRERPPGPVREPDVVHRDRSLPAVLQDEAVPGTDLRRRGCAAVGIDAVGRVRRSCTAPSASKATGSPGSITDVAKPGAPRYSTRGSLPPQQGAAPR